MLLVFLAIGNSMYFFGRSHEHNIINISGVLVMALFLLFDVTGRAADELHAGRIMRTAALSVLPVMFVLASAYLYSGRVVEKAEIKYDDLMNLRLLYPPDTVDVDAVKKLTGGSRDVYIVSDRDCLYYYYGNYVPQGRFIPYASWVSKPELAAFLKVSTGITTWYGTKGEASCARMNRNY